MCVDISGGQSACVVGKYARLSNRKLLTWNLNTGRFMCTFGMPFVRTSTASVVFSSFFLLKVHQRFLHFHGQECARLNRNQSIHKSASTPPYRSTLIILLSPLLFCAPDVHLNALDDLWVDETICHVPWKGFIDKLNTDWERYILFVSYSISCHYSYSFDLKGTVILNANVGFLAIGAFNSSAPASVLSYMSTLASIGSIITGLLLFRQNQTKDKNTADAAVSGLSSCLTLTLLT